MDDGTLTKSGRQLKMLKLGSALLAMLIGGNLIFSGCNAPNSDPSSEPASYQISPLVSQATAGARTATPILTPQATTPESLYIWGSYAGPSIDPVTPVPPPLANLDIPEEVLIWVLLGVDKEPPFLGRTNAIHLLLINPRLAKASLVSIPSNLFVYIPGYTMQRINTAYALGGMALVRETLAYNFGLNLSRFVVAHPGDFKWLVDDVDGLEVSVLFPLPNACNGIPSGLYTMNGSLALCYASFQSEMDEMDRMRRQQQLLRLIFINMVYNGNLARLPQLYASYKDWVNTDFSMTELLSYVPLALKLGDPERVKYYMVGWDEVSIWELPGTSQAKVFLPDRPAVLKILQNALNSIMEPSPLSELVRTLEYQLTEAMTRTPQETATSFPSATTTPTWATGMVTPVRTSSPTQTVQPTPTPPLYPITTVTPAETAYP